MLPLYKKYWRTAFDIGLIALTVFLTLLVFSKMYQIAAPVFLSFIVFLIIEPLAKFLHRKGLPKAFASAIAVLLFIMLILGVLFGAGLLLATQISSLSNNMPHYTRLIQDEFTSLVMFLQSKINLLPANIINEIDSYFNTFTSYISGSLTNVLMYLFAMLSSFSTFIANFGIATILAFFLSVEIGTWRKFAREKTPNTIKNAYIFMKTHVFGAIGKYIKAQMIMVSISFVILLVGLLILNTGNELTIALVSAVLDILPLVGVPVIFIPWIIYLFIVGNYSLAIGLTILLAVVMVSRQLLEPKIAGNSIGVTSAFLMLSCMIISLSLFGIAGLILTPVLIILIKELLQQGYLQKWIRLPKEEFTSSPFEMSPQPAVDPSAATDDSDQSLR